MSRSVCRRMRDAGRKGSIISISSIAGLDRGQLPGGLHYTVSKAGVNCMTKVIPGPVLCPAIGGGGFLALTFCLKSPAMGYR